MKYLIIISIFLVSCNPCKYVSKHPECFPADTVIINNEVIHHEKEYITNDSIVHDTVPCDPITNTYYKTNTVYKTQYKEIIDTIYQSKSVSKINPLNQALKKSNEKLLSKVEFRNKAIGILFIILLLLGIVLYIKR